MKDAVPGTEVRLRGPGVEGTDLMSPEEKNHGLQQSEETILTSISPRDAAFTGLLRSKRMSIAEVVRLTAGNIDFDREEVTIDKRRARLKRSCPHCREAVRRNHLFCPTCGSELDGPIQEIAEWHQQRVIPLEPATISSIREYLEWRRGFPYDGPLLFPFSRQRGWQILQRVKKLAELKALKQTTPANNKEFR
jgi:site-specific recombinase XerD